VLHFDHPDYETLQCKDVVSSLTASEDWKIIVGAAPVQIVFRAVSLKITDNNQSYFQL